MDIRKPHKFHPIHRSTLRRLRLRKDFADSVAALTAEEEVEFEALRVQMRAQATSRTIQCAIPATSAPTRREASTEPVIHEHLPAFKARESAQRDRSVPLHRQAALLVGGIVLAAGLCLFAGAYASIF